MFLLFWLHFRFPPPVVPLDFIPFHKFASALQSKGSLLKPEPPDARPPLDPESRKTIEGLASFVAKSGQRFEDMSREKHIGNPAFAFLFGGEGHDYYVRRLWEEEKNLAADGKKQLEVVSRKVDRSRQELNAERRGHLLGETPLVRENVPVASLIAPEDRARLQSALSSTFTKSASVVGSIITRLGHKQCCCYLVLQQASTFFWQVIWQERISRGKQVHSGLLIAEAF
jgi:G patch domain-containing protein 1